MGDRGRGTRTYVVALLLSLCAGLGTLLTPAAAPAARPSEVAALGASPAPCPATLLSAGRPITRIRPGGCPLTGRRISHGPLTARIPAPGHGTVLKGLARDGEWKLDVRTRPDGVVVVRTGSPAPRVSTGAVIPGNDTLAAAAPVPVPWSVAGSTTGATADADDQAAAQACDSASQNTISATAPSVWYAIAAPGDTTLLTGLSVTATYSDDGYDVSGYRSLFTRDAAGALVAVVCDLQDTDAPRLLAGHPYYLLVQSVGGTLDFVSGGRAPTAAELPPGDAFGGALKLPLGTSVRVDRYDRATLEPGEPAPPCGPPPFGSVWFRVDPGAWTRIALTHPLDSETVTLWHGSSPSALRAVGCFAAPVGNGPVSTSAPTRFVLTDSGPYYLQVALTSTEARSSQSFELTSDDSCSGRCLPPCKVRDYKLDAGIRPRDPWRWSFNVAGGLKGLSAAQVLRSIKAGARIVTTSDNDCGLADKVSAKTHYTGTSRAKASMCRTNRPDGKNVVAVFPQDGSSTLGKTCYYMVRSAGEKKWRITESDMEIYAKWGWTTDGDAADCKNQQDLVGVVAHEVGHVFGLDHAAKSRAGNLTMFPIAPPDCNASQRSLGLGDVLALRALY